MLPLSCRYLGLTWFGPLRTANQDVKWPNPFKRCSNVADFT